MAAPRPSRDLIYVVDGTLSRLEPGRETNAGLLWKLLAEAGPRAGRVVAYHPGVQGAGLARWWRAAVGEGVNDAVRHGYAFLASRWREGDRIFLFGYSRGAYAVRSLAGMIGRVGLLHPESAIERRVQRAFRHYAAWPTPAGEAFARVHCRRGVEIEMIGVWDTVAALGLPLPILSRLHPMATEFHDHALGPEVRSAYHALALDEDRTAFAPVMWERSSAEAAGRLVQAWFPGAHGDVGGELRGYAPARPLANVALAWMLERAEGRGLALPEGWRGRFPADPAAPMAGARRGVARGFLLRAPRVAGRGDGERLAAAARLRRAVRPEWRPRALGAEALQPERE